MQHDIYYNFEPIVIDNIFTEEELADIYNTRFNITPNLKTPDGQSYIFNDQSCGYSTSVYPPKPYILKKIEKVIQDNTPINISITNDVGETFGIHMPRYTLSSGSKPQLRPHYDVGLQYASFTLSIQLDKTKDWDVCVGDKCFTLQKNQAVLFSGSHQIHWRPDIEFTEKDYYDIIVCQAVENVRNPLPLDDAHRAYMQEQADNFVRKYFT